MATLSLAGFYFFFGYKESILSEITKLILDPFLSFQAIRARVGKFVYITDSFVNIILDYSQVIDHYENPRNVGSMDKDDINVGTGLVGAPACGDVMKLQVS